MFEDVLRELRKLEQGTKITIQLELDDNGYLDRLCPSDECNTHFKVHFDDWRNVVRDGTHRWTVDDHKSEFVSQDLKELLAVG